MSEIVVSSRVRLARNYEDLPFRNKITREQSEECVQRTLEALRPLPQPYTFLPLKGMEPNEKKALVEAHLISPDLMEHEDTAAALIRDDEKISVMMNEEDHLRIQGFTLGENLNDAAECAFSIEDVLQESLSFAFDPQWGYLTACPTNAGTGLRASVMLHLPMLTAQKQMGKVNQIAAKLGLTLRGIYGEGSEAQGNLYQLSNQVTLGRT
ncbi:MAG: ATP--guanido phosphotransferase, partial [Clostridia bacterium]|nr:ATP--guanido phosphotransferase [Clostridia bacterium]